MAIRIVFISDTHGLHGKIKVPDGDILVHAGDITMDGDLEVLADFNRWLGALPHQHKVIIAGNHDFCFENRNKASRDILTNATYLQDESAVVAGIKFHGSPWQPWFFDWAFNLPRGPKLKAKWNLIPSGTDILVTHGGPMHILDRTQRGEDVGCADLADAVRRIKPRVHVFGHIHEAYGTKTIEDTLFINPSSCNADYAPANKPVAHEWK